MPSVECIACGLLATRDPGTGALLALTSSCRKTGHQRRPDGRDMTVRTLLCYAGSTSFPVSEETKRVGTELLALARTPIECEKFERHIDGQHPEVVAYKKTLEASRKVAKEEASLQIAEQLHLSAKQHEENLRVQKEAVDEVKAANKEARDANRMSKWAVVIAVLALLAAIVAPFVEGWSSAHFNRRQQADPLPAPK